jgi:hypothetical protein
LARRRAAARPAGRFSIVLAAADGRPAVVVRVARTPDGAAWRASFGVAYDAGAGHDGGAIDAATFDGARLAAEAYWLALSRCAAAFDRHNAPDDVEPVEPSGGIVLPFRNRGELAPTG